MSNLPPSWVMGAVGLDGIGDTHLAAGVHLRVFTCPAAGLPTRPFAVYRVDAEIAQNLLGRDIHQNFTWIDSQGRVLTVPFAVTAQNPVTGFIVRPFNVRPIGVGLIAGGIDGVAGASVAVGAAANASNALTMEAFIDTPQGRRVLGNRASPAYVLTASEIHGVVLSGTGTVRGAWWMQSPAAIVDKLKPLMLLDLPVEQAARYVGLPNARARAEQRVRAGAPQRLGLHDDPSVSGPAGAAAASDADEWFRVAALAGELQPYLDQALNDISAHPEKLTLAQLLSAGVQPQAGVKRADIYSMRAVLSATADPGLAKWLGFSAVDTDAAARSGSFTLYLIRGFLAIDPSELSVAQALSLALSGPPLAMDIAPNGLPYTVAKTSVDGFPVYDFTVPLLVFPGAPPARPPAPGLGSPLAPSALVGPNGSMPLATADGLGPWLAEFVPPDAKREVILPLAKLQAAPTLAAARQFGTTLTSLNALHPTTHRALALVPAVPENATDTGTGQLADRTVPPDAVSYRVAQADWFGRWSEWGFQAIGAKARPLPPAPSIDVHYVLAAESPVDDLPRFGHLHVRLRVPRPEDLAPGSNLVLSARVDAIIDGIPVSVSVALANPNPSVLEIEVPAPAGMIARAGSVMAEITACWSDGVNVGPACETIKRELVDPRPPVALTLDPSLRYSARPDAVGRARVVLDWTVAANTRYRVYTTDETRLLGALEDAASAGNGSAQSLLQELAAAPTAAHRAQAYTQPSRAALFTRGLFNSLTTEPMEFPAGPVRYAYDLSGSLRVLAFFKIVAISASNVESPFTDATLLPIGVPSAGPPPRPLLDLAGWSEDGQATLQVTAVRGPQLAVNWRLRRSFAESSDPLRMPVVKQGTFAQANDGEPVSESIVDDGSDSFAGGQVRPWTRTSWCIEVQAPSLVGSALPGEWSPASAVVSGMFVPPAPQAPSELLVTADAADNVRLTWKHPDTLVKGSLGGYRFDIYRLVPGMRETLAKTVAADDPSVVSGTGSARAFSSQDSAAGGTQWRVVVLDPVGRMSSPTALTSRS